MQAHMKIQTWGWCHSHRHVWADTSWVTHCCLQAKVACRVSKLWYHSHRGQRQPSSGVHSALEATSGFVCLEMRIWGGSETPSTQNQIQELFTHLTFTGVVRCLSFPLLLQHMMHVYVSYPFNLRWDNCKGSKGTVWLLQQVNTDFPQWDTVSVFSKFYNDKDKAITKVTLNFNK